MTNTEQVYAHVIRTAEASAADIFAQAVKGRVTAVLGAIRVSLPGRC